MAPRLPRKVLLDGDIRGAALRVITEFGIDDLGIPQIAAAAGVTSAPVYRRFDSADDIAAELWATSLRPHFIRSARAAMSWTTNPTETEWLLAPFAPAMPPAVANTYDVFANEYMRPEHWALDSRDIPYVAPPPLQWSSGERALDDLRLAAVQVVGQYGVANATVNRITRRAGRSVNTAYRRLGSKNELVAEAVGIALNSEFGFSGNENATSMPFGRADRIARSLQVLRNHIDDRNLAHRSFLLEALLAARHNRDVEREVTAWFTRVSDRFERSATELSASDAPRLTDLWRFRIVAGIGSLVLSLASSQFANRYDPMPAISANDAVVAALLGTNR